MLREPTAETGRKETTKEPARCVFVALLAVIAVSLAPGCDGVVMLGKNRGGAASGAGGASDASASALGMPRTAEGGSGPAGSSSAGGTLIFGDSGPPSRSTASEGGLCGVVHQSAEQIVVYRDATVTDTVIQHKPAAIAFMLDRSSDMNPDGWNTVASAIGAFVDEPASSGLDVGLGTFPGGLNAASCDGRDCGTLLVPIDLLPRNGPAVHSFLSQPGPGSGIARPTECGLRGMIDVCQNFMAASPLGELCVPVLVTDGAPTQCDTNYANLVQIVADGHARGVSSFFIALPGSDKSALDTLAQAGGTTEAVALSGGAQAFTTALEVIRQKVTETVVTTTTTTVVQTTVPCEFTLPRPPQGSGVTFDPSKVNVQFTRRVGAPLPLRYVSTEADCGRAGGPAWFYDDPQDPRKVILCPEACTSLVNSSGAGVDILFGCATELAVPQ